MKRLFAHRHTKTLLKHLLGWLCILLGVIMLITPGQGIITILIGIYLLADHSPFFARVKNSIQHRFPRTAVFIHEKKESFKRKLKRSAPK